MNGIALNALIEPDRPMARLFGYLRSYKRALHSSVLFSVCNKVLDLMPPLLVGWTIDTVTNQDIWITDWLGTEDRWLIAQVLAGLVIVIFGLESAFQWLYQRGFMNLAQHVQHDLRMDAYNQLQSREIGFFENHRMGETMAMLNDDVNQLERFMNTGFNELVQLLTLFCFAGFVLFSTSWPLASIGMLPIPIIILGSLYYQRKIAPRYQKVREAVGKLSSRLENNISGMVVVKSFTAEEFESNRVGQESAQYRDANKAAIRLSAIYVPLIRMAIAMGFALVLLIGGYWVLTGQPYLKAGELVMFSMMIQRLLWPLTRLGTTLDELERARAAARRTFGLLDTPCQINDPASPATLHDVKGAITLDDVRFSYERGDAVLRGASFRVSPGETLGIAGPTGAGKSTLVKLLLRLYDVSDGRILLDDTDIRDITQRDLRSNIALVSQDVYIFHGTVRENIAYGLEDPSIDAIEHAAKVAHLHEFIESLPDKYETIVGEHGIKLSGGQRQRLSIARAILKDAPIMLFDEATSSVDTETEREIQTNLEEFTSGKTAIVIAHRLSTIRNADRIIVLSEGVVSEEGHHDELVLQNGTYADLWRIQSGEIVTSPGSRS